MNSSALLFITLVFTQISCHVKKNNKTESYSPISRYDTIIPSANIRDTVYERYFFDTTGITSLGVSDLLVSQRGQGVYCKYLLDLDRNEEAKEILEYTIPEKYAYTLDGSVVPIFRRTTDQYLLYSLLRSWQVNYGLSENDILEMYIKNYESYGISRISERLKPYYKCE